MTVKQHILVEFKATMTTYLTHSETVMVDADATDEEIETILDERHQELDGGDYSEEGQGDWDNSGYSYVREVQDD